MTGHQVDRLNLSPFQFIGLSRMYFAMRSYAAVSRMMDFVIVARLGGKIPTPVNRPVRCRVQYRRRSNSLGCSGCIGRSYRAMPRYG